MGMQLFTEGIFSESIKFVDVSKRTTMIDVIIEVELEGKVSFSSVKVPEVVGSISFSEFTYNGARFKEVNENVMVCSHRAYWEDVNEPENTIIAIQKSLDLEYEMIELDIIITADGQAIVFHDRGLNKRTTLTGATHIRTYNELKDLYIKNGFDELIEDNNTKLITLTEALEYVRTYIDNNSKPIFINLDRAANEMDVFKIVYPIVEQCNMLDYSIFKGGFKPELSTETVWNEQYPTVSYLRFSLEEIYPNEDSIKIAQRLMDMLFTPVLFDNNQSFNDEGVADPQINDDDYALELKAYIDEFISTGTAAGFELTYKAYPIGSTKYAIDDNKNIVLLRQWTCLADEQDNPRSFVEYIHDKGYPIGIYASTPEVCAIPNYTNYKIIEGESARNLDDLGSGFLKEYYGFEEGGRIVGTNYSFKPYIKDQKNYDFRGDWDFYIPAGADYVITDRPDALREYLKAIGRFKE